MKLITDLNKNYEDAFYVTSETIVVIGGNGPYGEKRLRKDTSAYGLHPGNEVTFHEFITTWAKTLTYKGQPLITTEFDPKDFNFVLREIIPVRKGKNIFMFARKYDAYIKGISLRKGLRCLYISAESLTSGENFQVSKQ